MSLGCINERTGRPLPLAPWSPRLSERLIISCKRPDTLAVRSEPEASMLPPVVATWEQAEPLLENPGGGMPP